jgi:hypothetical protein
VTDKAIDSHTAEIDGVTLHYLTPGHGPPVLLLHNAGAGNRGEKSSGEFAGTTDEAGASNVTAVVVKDSGALAAGRKPYETTAALGSFL